MIAANNQPISAEKVTAMRPASHTATSVSNGVPWIGSRPVQFGIAVSRKPVTTAGRKPYSISCTCQSIGPKAVDSASSPLNIGSQARMASPA